MRVLTNSSRKPLAEQRISSKPSCGPPPLLPSSVSSDACGSLAVPVSSSASGRGKRCQAITASVFDLLSTLAFWTSAGYSSRLVRRKHRLLAKFALTKNISEHQRPPVLSLFASTATLLDQFGGLFVGRVLTIWKGLDTILV